MNLAQAVEWYSAKTGKVQFMALNIKNEGTEMLAHELSKLTGESITAAITEALRERLNRVRSERGAGLAGRILKIGKDCASHLHEPYRSTDHRKLLYDEKGMPR
jgi:antitoxin VapB